MASTTPLPANADGGPSAKVYLPGLHGIRFIAASAVIIHHIEQGKSVAGLPSLFGEGHPLITQAGGMGVTLFFVLSGYLITYLLISELRTTGGIGIRNFYIRRVLRIWPLYYLIVFLGWVVVPQFGLFHFGLFVDPQGPDYFKRIAFFLLLCPQLVPPRYATPTLAGPLWSVGVEEQFYAFWPWLVRSRKGRILFPALAVIVLCILSRFAVRAYQHYWAGPEDVALLGYLKNVVLWSRFSCMAIGGLGAWLALDHGPRIRWLFRRRVQLAVLILFAVCIALKVSIRMMEHEFYSLFFIYLILNVSLNRDSFLKLESRPVRFLGEISYGLYVYHWFVIVALLNALGTSLVRWSPAFRNGVVYAGVFGMTVAVASASYYFLERPFLRMKRSFAAVLSGSEARAEQASQQ